MTSTNLNKEVIDLSDRQDAEANKWYAALAYILFFIPLLAANKSRFAMFHANQGLILLLAIIASNIVLGLIPFLGFLLLPLCNLAALVLAIIGILNSFNGLMRPLPVIGELLTIIKAP